MGHLGNWVTRVRDDMRVLESKQQSSNNDSGSVVVVQYLHQADLNLWSHHDSLRHTHTLSPFILHIDIVLHESLQLLAQRKRWFVLTLAALGRRLNHALSSVTLGSETGEGVGFLFLEEDS